MKLRNGTYQKKRSQVAEKRGEFLKTGRTEN